MKYRSVIVSVLLSVGLLLLGIGCTNPLGSGDNGGDDPIITDPVVGFNVTGKVVDKDGKPVVGARAKLLSTGLSAVTNEKGEYTIKGSGKISGKLAKRVAVMDTDTVEGTDTLVVLVANPENPGDSSEVIKTTVTSGVIDTLPTTYIVQREIAVPYVTASGIQIGRVVATVYDVAVPDIKKTIDLANDATRKAFTTFAYFSSEKNKNYILYTIVYDVNGKFIGRSTDYPFSDNYGNLSYATPFRCNNATPSVTVNAPEKFVAGQSIQIGITAVDSFGGQVVSCEYDAGNTGKFVAASVGVLKKSASVGNSYIADITVPEMSSGTFKTVIKTVDNEDNVSIDTLIKEVKNLKLKFNNSYSINTDFFDGQELQEFLSVYDEKDSIIRIDSARCKINNGEWVTMPMSTEIFGLDLPTFKYTLKSNGGDSCIVEVEVSTKLGTVTGSRKYKIVDLTAPVGKKIIFKNSGVPVDVVGKDINNDTFKEGDTVTLKVSDSYTNVRWLINNGETDTGNVKRIVLVKSNSISINASKIVDNPEEKPVEEKTVLSINF